MRTHPSQVRSTEDMDLTSLLRLGDARIRVGGRVDPDQDVSRLNGISDGAANGVTSNPTLLTVLKGISRCDLVEEALRRENGATKHPLAVEWHVRLGWTTSKSVIHSLAFGRGISSELIQDP